MARGAHKSPVVIFRGKRKWWSIPLLIVCFTLIILFLTGGPVVKHPGQAIGKPSLTEKGLLTRDGAVLALNAWPSDSQPARGLIIALHGINDYAHFFDRAGKYFSDHGYTSYAYDQRGFGRSPHRGYWAGVDSYVKDLEDAVKAVRARHPDLPVYLIGASMGGGVVLAAMGSDAPPEIDGIILAAPAVGARKTLPWYFNAGLWFAVQTVPWWSVESRGLSVKTSDNERMLRDLIADPWVGTSTRLDMIYGLINLSDAAFKAAQHFEGPSLVLFGERDPFIPVRERRPKLEKLFRASQDRHRIIYYPDGYHLLLRDLNADVVYRDILQWMQSHRSNQR